MTTAHRAPRSARQRIGLLAAQAFALGLMMAWVLIPSSAIFLDTFGPGLLPVTYIGAAAAGAIASRLLARAFRQSPLPTVATRVLTGLSFSLVASWLVLSTIGANGVSFGLLVFVPIGVPIGFMFIVGQAGLLLDVRTLKVLYARVIAGFALGYASGGLAGPVLMDALGQPEDLLAAAGVVAGVFLLVVTWTRYWFPTELSAVEHIDNAAPRPTLRALLRNRYVVLILGFQMLSAVESQWLDFLVYDSASRRYADPSQLADFVSRFTAIAYGSDVLVLVLVAGVLLHRFGLRYGLTANPGVVLTLVVAVLVAMAVQGNQATIVFVLIVGARVTDLVFSDAAARTSLGAAYQAVPDTTRLVAQATVEGLAVPVAIGVSGLVVLIVGTTVGTSGVVLPLLTAMVVSAWIVVAVLMYRGYRANLLSTLRHRALDPAALSVDDVSNLNVIDRLIASDDHRDVRLGLDALAAAEHPALPDYLRQLTTDRRLTVRTDALDRLLVINPDAAVSAARDGLHDPSAITRAACVAVLGEAGDRSDLDAIADCRNDVSRRVGVATLVALARLGGDIERADVTHEIAALAAAREPSGRVTAAEALAACPPDAIDRGPLRALIEDPDLDVVNAALGAVRWPEDLALFDEVIGRLPDRRTAGAAVDALVSGGAVLPFIDDALTAPVDRRVGVLLARASRTIGGPEAIIVLQRHLEHSDLEIGLAVMNALAALVPRGLDHPVLARLLRAELERAALVLRALTRFGDDSSAALLRSALRDELDLIRRRVLATIALEYGVEPVDKVALQLEGDDSRAHAVAIEWLDATLTGTDRACIPLLEPGVSDSDRLQRLSVRFPIESEDTRTILHDLVEDRDRRWRQPWLSACALHDGFKMKHIHLDLVLEQLPVPSTGGGVPETGDILGETLAGLRQRND